MERSAQARGVASSRSRALEPKRRAAEMADDPKTFWGKIAAATAFIGAIVALGTLLKECSGSLIGPPPSTRGPYVAPGPAQGPDVTPLPTPEFSVLCCVVGSSQSCQPRGLVELDSTCVCLSGPIGIGKRYC